MHISQLCYFPFLLSQFQMIKKVIDIIYIYIVYVGCRKCFQNFPIFNISKYMLLPAVHYTPRSCLCVLCKCQFSVHISVIAHIHNRAAVRMGTLVNSAARQAGP